MPPDWKPEKAIRDPEAKRAFHRSSGKVCAVCGVSTDLSLHHVFDRDDVPENYIALCGDGVRGCHGLVTRNDVNACAKLGAFIFCDRPDIIGHVARKIGEDRAAEWFHRRLLVGLYLSET